MSYTLERVMRGVTPQWRVSEVIAGRGRIVADFYFEEEAQQYLRHIDCGAIQEQPPQDGPVFCISTLPKPREFKVGDVVQLKSGGCAMAVSGVFGPKDDEKYECVWLDHHGRPGNRSYGPTVLKLY